MKKLILPIMVLCATMSMAQNDPLDSKKDTVSLEEVVITANRIKEKKTDAVANVTIIDQKKLQQFIKIAPDMSHLIGMIEPAMSLSTNTTNNRYQNLRGRSILVLIDGIPQSTPLRATDRDIRSIDPAAVERIEIVKGATSIYGNGAIGGIMNIVTKKSPKNVIFGGQTTIGASARDSFKENRGFGYRFNQQFYGNYKGFSYLVDAAMNQTGSAIDGTGEYISPRYGLGDVRTYNGLVKLGYQFDDDNKVEAMYNFYQSLQNTPLVASGGKYLERPRIGVYDTKDPAAQDEGMRYNHNAYIKFNSNNIFKRTDLELSAFTQHQYAIFDYRKHNARSPRWESSSGQATVKGEKYGIRTQLTSKFLFSENVFTQLLYGADVLIDKTSQPLVDGRYWMPELTSYNSAPFLQTKTTFFQYYVLKAGLRYDYIDVSVPNYEVLRLRNTDPRVYVKGGDLTYNNLSPNIGIAYNQFKYFQPFISYSQGFSIFDLGRTLRAAKADVLSKINTEPVKTENYEAGAYAELSKYVHLSGSYFYTYSKLGSDLKSVSGFWVVDRTPQKVYGFEVNADIFPTKWLTLGGSFISFEGKKKSTEDGDWDGYMSGTSIPAPKATAYIRVTPTEYSYLQVNYLHTGSRDRFSPDNRGVYTEGEGIVYPIDLFSLSAGYTFNKSFSLALGIENLTDKVYYTPASMLVARDAEYARGNGRYFNLSLTYRY
ncbi:TonB-dependent receptor [Capnocytophaga sputigena]|jgi:tonB-dependent receptor|uniref:TonB-dependent receptor n=1 Tax=Capnocytophaga sputigena TaxID=1019 RepID=A0A2A3N449_CAPSP|nr:TonB-dependent receptor [Capnocytophaga sputigena]ATA78775.1 TonB-dependent receptor [Capnocytophaga sputigena]PBN46531.1 TonB-dependent receptor [Capnocytophaga sputigena]